MESLLGFYLHRDNPRWEEFEFRGQMEIHTSHEAANGVLKWYTYLLWFKDGRVTDLQPGPGHGEVLADPATCVTVKAKH